jgi:hypothetical protein
MGALCAGISTLSATRMISHSRPAARMLHKKFLLHVSLYLNLSSNKTIAKTLLISYTFKGIDRPFGGRVKSRLIQSLLINWRLGNFYFLILNGVHHKISKKAIDNL